ncbi:mediator of RNA polymerase II transcription subunit 15a [Trifolium repens]|nr:mediator of RNA polymerase II transcription subunit 15a [Trifolium repens]
MQPNREPLITPPPEYSFPPSSTIIRYIAGAEPSMDTSDWRGQLQPEKRKELMDILERHLPVSGQEGLHELREIAQRFEEKIFTTATSQYDYLRKISIKMLTLENRHQGTMANYIPPNQVGPNNKPPDPDEMAPKMKRSKLAKLVSEGEKAGIIPSILKDWRNDKPASLPILGEKRKRDAAVGTSQQVPGVVTHDRKLTASSSVPNVSENVTT